jgi:hypothetical protein
LCNRNADDYQMELDRAQKAGKMDKENGKDKISKAQTGDDADSDDEERPGLFEPKHDDKQAKETALL